MKSRLVQGLVVLLSLMGLGIGYLVFALPHVGAASSLRVNPTPERIAHGEYLAKHVMMCVVCHSERDWTQLYAPVKDNTVGVGGEIFDQSEGLPGRYVAPNITPAAIGSWTDGELERAIVTGESRDERPLFPIMPYPHFAHMDPEDLQSIIAYIRSLAPVQHAVEPSHSDFPMSIIVHTIPQPAPMGHRPRPEEPGYGEYITRQALCAECHTMRVRGDEVEGMRFAGGAQWPVHTGGSVRSANLTPDLETGLGRWTREAFIARFKACVPQSGKTFPVEPGQFNTQMPWRSYAGMAETDLGAIYDYLRTLPPVSHQVTKFTAP